MTRFGDALIESLDDALGHARGAASGVRVHTAKSLTSARFAAS
jgi:hypothetical protein